MSDRPPALTEPYMTMVNMSRSTRHPDDWRASLVEPATWAEKGHSPFARGFLFAAPMSGVLWVAFYGLWRLCGG